MIVLLENVRDDCGAQFIAKGVCDIDMTFGDYAFTIIAWLVICGFGLALLSSSLDKMFPKGGISHKTLYNREFSRARRGVLRRDGHRCQSCGMPGPGLHVHHEVWRSRGGSNNPMNLTTLCKNCHRARHRRF